MIKGFHYGDSSSPFGRRKRHQKPIKKGKNFGGKKSGKKPKSSEETKGNKEAGKKTKTSRESKESKESKESEEVVNKHEKPTPVQTTNTNASYFNLPYSVYSATNGYKPNNKCKYKPNF